MESFGDYEILEEIGRGGMGVVYKARQIPLNRTVALKMLLMGDQADEHEIQRFQVEAEAAAHLDHPGIVPVYEAGALEGRRFIAMGYIHGSSLADRIARDTPLSHREVAMMIQRIAEAIGYAHANGVVHRDLKPANILIDEEGHPHISDFGIAKRTDVTGPPGSGSSASLTVTGQIIGTPHYMSPEQASGNAHHIGPTSDIYSLGAIFYVLLLGRPPFQAHTLVETLKQVVELDPMPPRRLNPHIPRDLETICMKCLEKNPLHRYSSAMALAEDVERYLNDEPVLARPVGRWTFIWKWCRRNPLSTGLAAGLALVLFVAVVVATTLINRAQAEQKRVEDQKQMIQMVSKIALRKALDETDEWLQKFFNPVQGGLLVARSWGRDGLLEEGRPKDLNRLLAPLIENSPQISSLMVANSHGREHMLLCVERAHPVPGNPQRQWLCRLTEPMDGKLTSRYMAWSDEELQPAPKESPPLDYEPRQRPWYLGALAQRKRLGNYPMEADQRKRIHWTSTYQFFTTKDLGITASITFERMDDLDHVVAFDVLLKDISRYTTGKKPSRNGMVLVLAEEGRVIGLPTAFKGKSEEEWKQAFQKTPEELGIEVAVEAARQHNLARKPLADIRQFEAEGKLWWSGVKAFHLEPNVELWILVIIPNSDLQSSLGAE